ncbi:MAG: hypothetical protein ACPGYY_05040 [Bacteroidia bacterium]
MALSIYRKHTFFDEAKEIESTLNSLGIDTLIVDDVPAIDVTFNTRSEQNPVLLKIDSTKFEEANLILQEIDEKAILNVSSDHYLFDFETSELYEILQNQNDWSSFDFNLAKHILKKRGEEVSEEQLKSFKTQENLKLSKTKRASVTTLILGYTFGILGGFIGIVIGYSIYFTKQTLPNGEVQFSYDDASRKQGKTILSISILVFVIAFSYRLYQNIT